MDNQQAVPGFLVALPERGLPAASFLDGYLPATMYSGISLEVFWYRLFSYILAIQAWKRFCIHLEFPVVVGKDQDAVLF